MSEQHKHRCHCDSIGKASGWCQDEGHKCIECQTTAAERAAASPLPVEAGEVTHETHREVLRDGCNHCGASGNELREPCANAICPRCREPFGVCHCPPCSNCGAPPVDHLTNMAVCPRFKGQDAGDNVTQYEPAPPVSDGTLKELLDELERTCAAAIKISGHSAPRKGCSLCAPYAAARRAVEEHVQKDRDRSYRLLESRWREIERLSALVASLRSQVEALRKDALTPEEADHISAEPSPIYRLLSELSDARIDGGCPVCLGILAKLKRTAAVLESYLPPEP